MQRLEKANNKPRTAKVVLDLLDDAGGRLGGGRVGDGRGLDDDRLERGLDRHLLLLLNLLFHRHVSCALRGGLLMLLLF